MAEIETLGEHGFMVREEKETDGEGGGGGYREKQGISQNQKQ